MVQVWELLFPWKKDMEYNKREVTKLREEVKILNDKQHGLLNELEHYSRLLSSKDDDEKRHALNYDNSRRSMELEIDKLREEVELLREKGARYDELLRDYNFTKQEKELIEEKMGFYDKQANQTAPGGARVSQEEAQRRKLDMLAQDKEYLTKENIQLIEKNRRL
jgi:progesterone-induced-blocking factor 1